MTQPLRPIFNKMYRVIKRHVAMTRSKTDHHTLGRHIMELNQKASAIEIVEQSARCLDEILHLKIFAFVFQTGQSMNVWFDQDICSHSIENVIAGDFNMAGKEDIHYFSHRLSCAVMKQPVTAADLISYNISDESYDSKIYLVAEHAITPHHEEIIKLIHQSGAFALLRQKELSTLSNAAALDPLTGCYNRREFAHQLKKNIAGSIRHVTDLSILMFDLDHFKRVNDEFGHLAGDKVLQEIASLVRGNMRKGDVFARYGGEEFVAILPGTGKREAMEFADRIRIKISNSAIRFGDKTIMVTASFGVAELDHEFSDAGRLIQDADDMLYKAKLKGRNMVMPGLMKLFPVDTTTSGLVENMI